MTLLLLFVLLYIIVYIICIPNKKIMTVKYAYKVCKCVVYFNYFIK